MKVHFCITAINSMLLTDIHSPLWVSHRKHIFILSISGKPIYSRYGKEEKLVSLFGIMQALVSFVQDDRDSLRFINYYASNIYYIIPMQKYKHSRP